MVQKSLLQFISAGKYILQITIIFGSHAGLFKTAGKRSSGRLKKTKACPTDLTHLACLNSNKWVNKLPTAAVLVLSAVRLMTYRPT
jgi:hypothetical protein